MTRGVTTMRERLESTAETLLTSLDPALHPLPVPVIDGAASASLVPTMLVEAILGSIVLSILICLLDYLETHHRMPPR